MMYFRTFPVSLTAILCVLITLGSSPADGQTVVLPGSGEVCAPLDEDNGGQQSAVDLDTRVLDARATGSAGTERSSFAEITWRIRPDMTFPATLRSGVTFNGVLRGRGGGNLNFGRVRLTASLRNLTTDTDIDSATLFDKTEKGAIGTAIVTVVTDNPFNPTVAEFDHTLIAGNEYALTIRLTANARGGQARSDFLNGLRGATPGCLQIVPQWQDTDGDGIFDVWEVSGIDLDGDGENELDASDLGIDYRGQPITLNPNRKDVLVEMDYFACSEPGGDCSPGDGHTHDPATSVSPDNPMDPVVAAFDAAPVSNPNGAADGIALWLQLDEALPHQDTCDLDDGCFDAIKLGSDDTPGSFGTPAEKDDADRLTAKALIFRYAIWLHDKAAGNTSSGEADGSAGIAGDDFIISLGSWTGQVGTLATQTGLLMHELGHTLALGHGGIDDTNCKPNHLSIMNYIYTTQGLQPTDDFDYSRSLLPDAGQLEEDDLDEPIGVQDGAFDILFGPPDSSGNFRVGAGTGAIDWNADGDATDTSAQADLNWGGFTGCTGGDPSMPSDDPDDELAGSLDWDLLQYNFRDSPYFPAGQHGPELVPEIDRETAQRVRDMTWGGQNQVYFEYAVKFICGIEREDGSRFVPGRYATVVNIRNPNRDRVKFRKRLSLAYPPAEQRPGKVMPIAIDTLDHEEALKVDCPDVEKNVFDGDFESDLIDGFVVIQSPDLLDVRAVYTTARIEKDGGTSIDVEPQFARTVDLRKTNLRPEPGLPSPAEAGLPEGFPGVLFCLANPDGGASARIRARIRNTGPVAAEASTARADFGDAGSVSEAVGPLAPGSAQTVEFAIPRGCYPPGFSAACRFSITADATLQVDETDEGDNTVNGFCVSPAG